MDFGFDARFQRWECLVQLPRGAVSFRLPGGLGHLDRGLVASAEEIVQRWSEIEDALEALTKEAASKAAPGDAYEIALLTPVSVEFHSADFPRDWDVRLVGRDESRLWICEFAAGEICCLVEQVAKDRGVERRLVWEYEYSD